MRNKFYGQLELLPEGHAHKCNKPIKNNTGYFTEHWICNKPAVYGTTNGLHFFCRHHSLMGRYVIRNGDIGEILARFDTEEEVRANIHLYPGMRMQKISGSSRRDIY